MLPSEQVNPDGSINWRSTHGNNAEAGWNYKLAGTPGGETWMPDFFYHGARYLQVEVVAPTGGGALPIVEQLDVRVVHSDSPAIGEFECSNELFNRIRMLVRWAQRSNFAHVMTDCPHRERLGWLEQTHLNGPGLRSEFDLTRLFTKAFGDMEDAQLPNGLVPDITPEYLRFEGAYRDSPEWGSAIILAAWQHYLFTGDDTPMHLHYPAMQRYFDYLTSRADGHIVSHGLGDWCDMRPRGADRGEMTPIPLVATATYYDDAQAMARIAAHLGHTQDAQRYEKLAGQIADAFNKRFLDPATGKYATGSQASQTFPLTLGIVPAEQYDATLALLLEAIRTNDNAITTGEIAHPYMLRGLSNAGLAEVVFDIHSQTERPGYGYQLAHGETSLTETWTAGGSHNHFMMGHITEWLYLNLAGIAPDPSDPGFGRVIVRPNPVGDITWVDAGINTVRGQVDVDWKLDGNKFILDVTVPANARASVQLPIASPAGVTESGRSVAGRKDVTSGGMVKGRPTFEIGSGVYHFEMPFAKAL